MAKTSALTNLIEAAEKAGRWNETPTPHVNGATLERINVNEIEVPDYQRDIRPAKLRKMIRDWKPSRAGWIIVSRRSDGALVVIDGQHRVEAVRRLQGKIGSYLDGIVVDDWSSTQEAEFFAETQSPDNRSALNPEDIHHAALLAGNSRAIDLQNVLTSNGFRVGNRDRDAVETGRLKPVRAINDAYDRYGGSLLSDVLTTIREAWGVHAAPESCVITGMALFYGMYPQVAPKDVAKRMGETPLGEWVRLAKVRARSERMTANEGVAYKIRGDYNYNRVAKNRLPDFADTLKDHRSAIRSRAVIERMRRDGLPAAFVAQHTRNRGRRS